MRCHICGSMFLRNASQVKARETRCPPCKRAQQNDRNAANKEQMRQAAKVGYRRRKSYYDQYWRARRRDPAFKKMRAARRKVATEIEAGRMIRGDCECCGATKADAHHESYEKPLEVVWLCRSCHMLIEKAVV